MTSIRQIFLAFITLLVVIAAQANDEPPLKVETPIKPEVYQQLLELSAAGFRDKKRLVAEIADEHGADSVMPLSMLLHSQLYSQDDTNLYQVVETDAGKEQIVDLKTGQTIGGITSDDLDKVRTNNPLRKEIKQVIAQIALVHGSEDQKSAAVREMLGDMDEDKANIIRRVMPSETSEAMKEIMAVAIAIYEAEHGDAEVALNAIEGLTGRIEPEARAALNQLIERFPEDKNIRQRAVSALEKTQERIEFYGFVEKVFFGLSLGSVLLLAAIGLAITFGVMGVINMAHGEMIMLGAYTTYVVQLIMPNHLGYSILVAVPAAFIVSGLVGIAIQQGVIRFLNGRPLETLLATFGLSLVLQQAVRTIFSPLNRQVASPEWMSGALELNPVLSLTYNRLYILAFSLLVFSVLIYVMKNTNLGLNVRAVSQNRNMARAMGVRTQWVDAMTFGLGSGVAGVAGVALSQLTNVGPNLGQAYIIDSFMVVVFGGVGNLLGTLVASFSLGVANKFMEPVTGAVLAKILVLVFIILFIQKRPRGLFPQKGRAAE